MKQHITENDLFELTEEQEQNLRRLWIPKERDLAVAYICSNAESNEFEAVVFTVGRVDFDEFQTSGRYNGRNKALNIELRSLRLVDDSFYEELIKEDDVVEELELEYQTPDDHFSYEYCLPLLNIGQMIEILSEKYFTTTDFSITYNRYENNYQVRETTDTYNNPYSNSEPNELCDVLWDAVKTLL